jgi:hypothetical protein
MDKCRTTTAGQNTLPLIMTAATDPITDARKITRMPPDAMIVRTRAISALVPRLPATLDATLQNHMASAVATLRDRAAARASIMARKREEGTARSLLARDMITGATTMGVIDRHAILGPSAVTDHSVNETMIAHAADRIRKIPAGKVGLRRFPGAHFTSESARRFRANSRAITNGLTTMTPTIPRRETTSDHMGKMAATIPNAATGMRQRKRSAM